MSKKGTMSELIDKPLEELRKRAQRFKHKCPHCGKNIQILVTTGVSGIWIDKDPQN